MKRERLALTRVRSRLRRIAAATKRFAAGQYDQRLEVVAADEIGQIEAHLNRVAERHVELLAREKLLVEQNVHLEERRVSHGTCTIVSNNKPLRWRCRSSWPARCSTRIVQQRGSIWMKQMS
jgi:HAMP domain-containing protein